jgi:sugar (pentulose or hexulose) kinase
MEPGFYLGIDFGTSGCRGIAIDHETRVVARLEHAMPLPVSWMGHRAQEAGIWWHTLGSLLFELSRQIDIKKIRAIAINGTSGTVVLGNENGQPISPALMYDDQAIDQAAAIARIAPQDSGALGASSGLAKVLFLLEQDEAKNARYVFTQADWLSFQLSRIPGRSDDNNTLKLGFDPLNRVWPEWLAALDARLPSLLPICGMPGTFQSRIHPDVARRFGLDNSVCIVHGTTDSTAAAIATGIERPGQAVTSLGSTLVLKVLSETPVFSPTHGVYSHRLGDLWLVGGASNAGGAVLSQHFSSDEMQKLTPQLQPSVPTGYQYYPLPRKGERFPINDPNLEPRIEPIPECRHVFFQALLEGLTRIEKKGYDVLAELGAPYPTDVATCGGGAVNEAWTQMRKSALGVTVYKPEHSDAAYGSALLAKRGAAPA